MMTTLFVADMRLVSADAWWGYGARRKEWVLSHGGTIIHYEIDNISGGSSEYKAVMYDANGKYVEKEFGKKAAFDDAKAGIYKIVAYRGEIDKKTYKGGKKFAEIVVTAHPGETVKIKFDYKKKKVEMTTDYVKPIAKSTVVPVAEDLTDNSKESSIEMIEEVVHPDVLAKESGQVLMDQEDSNEQENMKMSFISIFVHSWDAVMKYFNFK